MFQDEAIFGRIGKIYKCWVLSKVKRPKVFHHKIRQFRYLFGAVDPLSGDSCFRIISHCDTDCMKYYLQELSQQYPDSYILLVCDNAAWHKSKRLIIPYNIEIMHIPPYTPEMNPAEQIWDEIREKYFANWFFNSLEDVIERLCLSVNSLTNEVIRNISFRTWIAEQFI